MLLHKANRKKKKRTQKPIPQLVPTKRAKKRQLCTVTTNFYPRVAVVKTQAEQTVKNKNTPVPVCRYTPLSVYLSAAIDSTPRPSRGGQCASASAAVVSTQFFSRVPLVAKDDLKVQQGQSVSKERQHHLSDSNERTKQKKNYNDQQTYDQRGRSKRHLK